MGMMKFMLPNYFGIYLHDSPEKEHFTKNELWISNGWVVMDPNTGNFINPPPVATLDGSGNYSMSLTSLPAGTYTVVARYSGDGTFAASSSPS